MVFCMAKRIKERPDPADLPTGLETPRSRSSQRENSPLKVSARFFGNSSASCRQPWLSLLLLLGLAAASIAQADADRSALASSSSRDAWSDYHAIVWHPPKPRSCLVLREFGIDSAALIAENRDFPAQGIERKIAPLRECGLGYYVENIATDFYSAYHRWWPGRPVNWRFVDSRNAYRENPDDLGAFMREPSLSDPGWQSKIGNRLLETVSAHRAGRPLFYNLADEPGIASLSAFWDFDFSRHSLREMRRWLKQRYRNLAALNAQWGTGFTAWDAVRPMTTAEAMRRADGNFSAWADFKHWMDVEFARALERGADAVRAADPRALAGIEGAQIPGWGGYDYSLLARAADLIELYDGGGNLEIARSLNPNLILLTTSGRGGAREAHALWRALLRGTRGVIFWDPKYEIAGERGRRLAPHLREIKSGLAALLIQSQRRFGPVAVLYSPASMRTQWMLDWLPRGNAWSERGLESVYEEENAVRTSMKGFLDFLGRIGLEARVVTSELIEKGALRSGIRVLVLPRILALSDREAQAIRQFVTRGGTVVADGIPGLFDRHSRRRTSPLLRELFPGDRDGVRSRSGQGTAVFFRAPVGARRADGSYGLSRDRSLKLMRMLTEAGVEAPFTLTRADGTPALDIETQIWRNGETAIIGLHRESVEAAIEPVLLTFRRPARVYDLRARHFLGTVESLKLAIDRLTPTLLAVPADAPPRLAISVPRRISRGETAVLTFGLSRPGRGASVLRFDATDPRGRPVMSHSGNAVMRDGKGEVRLDFGPTDIAGKWRVRGTDILTGASAATEFEVTEE